MAHSGGGREDCWSEGGTACLVDAWGDRYLHLNRGNLRQKDWSGVADVVNRRQELLGRPRRTDVQCKNRIDTVKKKYKLEKSKPGISQWPLFAKLDSLVGPAPPPSAASVKKSFPLLTFTVKSRNPNPNTSPNLGGFSGGSSSRFQSQTSSESSRGENDEEVDDDDDADDNVEANRRHGSFLLGGSGRRKRKREGSVECDKEKRRGQRGAVGQLARAIGNFAVVYERVECAKQQQMMELERHRMEFAKDLEFQRMKMFMEAQLEIEKMKRPKYSSASGKRS